VRVPIPGNTSGFTARPAYVYLPPAALRPRPPKLPLLLLLHGTPGSPSDWTTKGGLVADLDTIAAAHGGAAPITVMPDINGTRQADSECIRAGNADIEEYLTADVPDFVASRYPVSENHRQWSIGGISEGGTCALMLALRHPTLFSAFGDLSGLARPTVGDTDDPQATIRQLFGGSVSAYDQHDPLWLLRDHRYPDLHGWLSYGSDETAVGIDIAAVHALARRAQMRSRVVVFPGRHSWDTWTAAMQQFLPWLWAEVGS
jgi:S-formylglutathione hydrolase FrmB